LIKQPIVGMSDQIVMDHDLEIASKNLPFDISTLEQALKTLKDIGKSFYHDKISTSTQCVKEWIEKSL
jgi:hypothetical protein